MKRAIWVVLILAFPAFGMTTAVLGEEGDADFPPSHAEINLFILESFVETTADACRPKIDGEAHLTITHNDDGSWKRRFTNATFVEEENEYVPGERGCVSTGRIPLDVSLRYNFFLSGTFLVSVDGSFLAENTPVTLVVDENGLVQGRDNVITFPALESLPTPTPTPTPIPTPLPTPVPTVPAGEQADGTYLLRGFFILERDGVTMYDGTCFGTGGYSDIGSGTQVVVRDGDNSVIGVGELEALPQTETRDSCHFVFEIEVEETRFYQVSISRRGEMVYSFENLEEDGWTIVLSLG